MVVAPPPKTEIEDASALRPPHVEHSTLSTNPPELIDDPILRLPAVEYTTGIKKSAIYAMIKEGEFPAPIRLGKRSSGWLLSEINQWKLDRIAASRQETK